MNGSIVRVISVVETNLETRGRGIENDPLRRVRQYWTVDGELLAEVEECPRTHCNAVGHRLMPGKTKCDHCSATLAQIAEDAGQQILADRIRGISRSPL